jgi:hypothetical protein
MHPYRESLTSVTIRRAWRLFMIKQPPTLLFIIFTRMFLKILCYWFYKHMEYLYNVKAKT